MGRRGTVVGGCLMRRKEAEESVIMLWQCGTGSCYLKSLAHTVNRKTAYKHYFRLALLRHF